MLPVTEGRLRAAQRSIRVKDEHLQRVLDGQAYLVFDGAMGTMLQQAGLAGGQLPELLNLTHPEQITAIHRAYVQAGAQVVTTNTFGANALKLGSDGDVAQADVAQDDGAQANVAQATVADVFAAAIACARNSGARYVAADIGPTGALLEPLGTLSFDEAYNLFAEQVRAAQGAGADLVIIETMTDLLEAKAAVLAALENSNLPVFATMTFDETGRTFLGTSPQTAAITLAALGVDALGVNCSLGPQALQPLVCQMLESAPCPVIVQANAGLPQIVDGQTIYTVGPTDYVESLRPMLDAGASIVGGCCGTSPAYIEAIASELQGRTVPSRSIATPFFITGAQDALLLEDRDIAVVGERINPTGKKKLAQALRTGDDDFVVAEALAQAEAGAQLLDVNAGLPDIDEGAAMTRLVGRIQGACPLPLQIDSSDPAVIEAGVRAYAGKPLVNSVNGTQQSLEAVLPIVAHYGCAVVGLTLDDDGIPPTAEGRLAIAEHIVARAAEFGIPARDIVIDCLVMAAATNQHEVREILRTVSLVKQRLGVRTMLGVSNVSFGLPARPVVNATFLAAAFGCGLDLAIINPLDARYREVVDTWRVLGGQDEGAQAFVHAYAGYEAAVGVPASGMQAQDARSFTCGESNPAAGGEEAKAGLFDLVVAGNKGPVAGVVSQMLLQNDALSIINDHLIPALDEVGARYEAGDFFLPQLMASAEAAKAGFDVLRTAGVAARGQAATAGKGPVALATVKGDIHDIGKNIVRMLLENYGYDVVDLGRDVAPQEVVDRALEHGCTIVGLSALMTTTVKSMEETIQLLREQAPHIKVMVGGAVLTQAYADMVGADFYGKDAAASARWAEEQQG